MNILHVHAHYDDFEFVAAGTFEVWRRRLGPALAAKVIVCGDGSAGHHFRTREETARLRHAEQTASARLGQYQFELLRLPNGEALREGCLLVTKDLLAALWKAIRDFEPDYLFCPPLPADPAHGVHIDHVAVAQAVRQVAYMINVPHAFLAEYPADEAHSEPKKTPVILTVYDAYLAGNQARDLVVNVEEAFPLISEMAYCHRSQIEEWLPWVGRHATEAPGSLEAWRHALRRRFELRSARLGLPKDTVFEVFNPTAWGSVPVLDQLLADFPNLATNAMDLDGLRRRIASWAGETS
jgi:LmbE family N-acetylglucosaminyl deacetylase